MNNQTPSVPTEEVVDMSPFKKMVMTIGTLPNAFTESMTYYEALSYFVKQLDQLINVVDQNAEATKELQTLFVQLKSYVDNYFDNLNVQEEINHKLDEMAEGGELAGIIAQFLEMAPVFGYNTISDMAAADNLSDGCIAKVLGKTSADTGDGSFYRIRTRTGGDTPDGENLVAITGDDTIIAQIIPNYFTNQLSTALEETNSTVSTLSGKVTKLESKKHLVIIGDSFSTTTYNPESTSWYNKLANHLQLTYHNYAKDSAGFVHAGVGGSTFGSQLIEAAGDSSFDNDDVAMVIVYGGLNDMNSTDAGSMASAAVALFTQLNNTFSNAKIVFAGINCWPSGCWVNTSNGFTQYNYFDTIKVNTRNLGIIYINTTFWLFTDDNDNYSGLNNHPNELGNAVFASNMINALSGSSIYVTKAALTQLTNSPTTGSGGLSYFLNQNTINCKFNLQTDGNGSATFTMAKNICPRAYAYTSYPAIGGIDKIGYINKNDITGLFTLHGDANTTYYGEIHIPLI